MKLESLKSEKFQKLDTEMMQTIKGGYYEVTESGGWHGLPDGTIVQSDTDVLVWNDETGRLERLHYWVDGKGYQVDY